MKWRMRKHSSSVTVSLSLERSKYNKMEIFTTVYKLKGVEVDCDYRVVVITIFCCSCCRN